MTEVTHGQNDNRFKDLLSDVREDARNKANADRSKARLAGKVVRATLDGIIDSVPDKHGKGVDDAKMLYDEFIKAYSAKDPNAHSPKGITVQTSRLRKFVKFGEMTSLDPWTEFQRWAEAYRNKRAVNEGKDVRPEFEALYSCIGEQFKHSDTPLSDDEIADCCNKPAPADVELEDVLTRMCKELEGIITGENKKGLKDQHEQTIAAHAAIRERLAALTLAKAQEELLAKAAALGWVVNPATGEPEKLAA
jgi:hypothetical protein